MRIIQCAFAIGVGIALLACVSPPPTPEDSKSAGLALHLDARGPITVFRHKVDHVLFVEVDEEQGDSLLRSNIFYSNYSNDGYFYLLNPPPGRYIAVAGVGTREGLPLSSPPKRDTFTGKIETSPVDLTTSISFSDSIYFNEELVRRTEVTVQPGSLTFMGEFLVHTSVLKRVVDPVQAHYFRLLQPGESTNWFVQGLLHYAGVYSGRVETSLRDEGARERFAQKAAEHLKSAGWGGMLKGVAEGPPP